MKVLLGICEFADFVCKRGTPLPPINVHFLRIFLQNMLKKKIAQKTPDFGPKIGYGFGGYSPSPLYGQNFQQKGGYGFGGYPPPFTDKIRKVVFDGLPYRYRYFQNLLIYGLSI